MAAETPSSPIPSLAHLRSRVFIDVRSTERVESSWGVDTSEAVLYECPASGLRFRLPAKREEIESFYGADYHDRMVGGPENERRTRAYEKENVERIRYLQRFCPRGRVLDVGCSAGLFARQLRDAGYDVLASDISEYACEQAAKLLGTDKVLRGPVESFAERLQGSLAAVTMMDVIEHFDDVVSPLRAVHRMLEPRGVLLLRTPTLSSPFYRVADWSYRLTGGRYTKAVLKIYHAEHFYFFNERSIRRLLEDTGFEVSDIAPDPLLWENFRSAELRQGPFVNLVLGAVYFAGRALHRGHGMRVAARRKA